MDGPIHDIIRDAKSLHATDEQKQEFLSLFHRPDVEFILKENLLEDLQRTSGSIKNKPFFDAIFEKLWRRRKIEINSHNPGKRLSIRFARWAAVLLVGLFLGHYSNTFKKELSPVYYTSVTPKGSVSEMLLPDGTHIFLNSGSKIKYSVDGVNNMREIFLTGEAWFQVAKMKEKPFLVHTSMYDIWVTGTSFNVKAYPDEKDVTTTLEEGHIAVKSSENLKLDGEILLKPGEQLVYNTELKDIQVHEVNTKWYTSWKDNKLVFVNMSLKDLTVLLERKYGVEIEIGDQSILEYHYDGTIKDETIFEVLEILKRTLPIQCRIVNQKIIIQKNN
jgi:ferric-dicitrate binding protein FerR (iron transport regulator)